MDKVIVYDADGDPLDVTLCVFETLFEEDRLTVSVPLGDVVDDTVGDSVAEGVKDTVGDTDGRPSTIDGTTAPT